VSETQPPWDPFSRQDQPQYPPQQPYGYQQPYGQQQPPPPPQPSFTPRPQYGPQPGGPPYQGQPLYGPPGGQQPYPDPGYGYGPPQQGPRRKRHRVRGALIGIGALLVVIIAAAVAASGGGDHTVTTGTSGAASTTSSPSKAAAAQTAKVGSVITLAGIDSGEQVAVTVVKVFRDAQSASDFDTPQSGDRLYAVQFRLDDTGSAAYSDSPSNGAEVVDAKGQSYQSSLDNAAECQSFPGTENIAAGSSGLGCIVFEVPVKAVITKVQFTLDSGMGPQTGQWDVRA
jgi:hypothetical protein